MKNKLIPRKKLIEARKKVGLTQEQLSKILGIKRARYSSYETGARRPKIETIIAIKRILNISNDDVFLTYDDTIDV